MLENLPPELLYKAIENLPRDKQALLREVSRQLDRDVIATCSILRL